jgi:hypothetical protein
MDRSKQSFNQWWDELTPPQRVGIAVLAGIEVIATSIALVDLAQRPRELVRGPKLAWGLACAVQPVGPLAYLALGRRKADAPA